MEEIRSGMFAVLDIIKCLIIVYGVFGFEIRKEKKAFWCVPVAVLGVIGYVYLSGVGIAVNFITQFLVILNLFIINLRTNFKVVILEFVLVNTLDMLIWLLVVGITPLGQNYTYNEMYIMIICHIVAIIIWFVIAYLIKENRKIIALKIEKVHIIKFLLIVIGIFSLSLLIFGIQGQYWNEMTDTMQRGTMILGVIVFIFLFTLLGVLFYVSDSKEKLQYINELNEQCIKYQKDYYMEIIKFDEEMRAFRHDVNKHYEVLSMLIYEKEWNRAKEYIRQLSDKKDIGRVFKTGNTIADYIINGKIKEIKNQGNVEINVIGRFPQKMQIEDTDLCIVLGNALDNAEEALEKVRGEKKLNIEIGSYKQSVFIEIANSSMNVNIENIKTTKKDRVNHGYGLQNIKYVVEKYNGKVTTEYENGCFSLKIEL